MTGLVFNPEFVFCNAMVSAWETRVEEAGHGAVYNSGYKGESPVNYHFIIALQKYTPRML